MFGARPLTRLALVLGGALTVLLPAGAAAAEPAAPIPLTCDDGSAEGIGGYTDTSDCASAIAGMQDAGCTVTHSDEPNGPQDTLTYDCGTGLPREYDRTTKRAVDHDRRAGNGNKNLPRPISQRTQRFECMGWSQGLGPVAVTQASVDNCVAQLTEQIDAWSGNIFDGVVGAGTWQDVRVSTRCEPGSFQNHVRDFGGYAIVTTGGSTSCTLIVYANPKG